jgi:hypothetical protein
LETRSVGSSWRKWPIARPASSVRPKRMAPCEDADDHQKARRLPERLSPPRKRSPGEWSLRPSSDLEDPLIRPIRRARRSAAAPAAARCCSPRGGAEVARAAVRGLHDPRSAARHQGEAEPVDAGPSRARARRSGAPRESAPSRTR